MKPIIPFSRKIQKRHETLTKRRYFYPTLFLDAVLWIIVALLVVSTSPELLISKVVFFIFFFLAAFLFLALIFDNSKRAVIVALGITFFLLLRILGVGSIVNALLIVAIIIATEFYTKST